MSARLGLTGIGFPGQMKEYDLERDDVLACIGYGAEMSRWRYLNIPVETIA